jgi:hypothetical protein
MNRIVIVSHPEHTHWREFLLSERLSLSLIERLHPEIVREFLETYEAEVGPTGIRVYAQIMLTDMVEEMYFYSHSLTVYKKPKVQWDKLTPLILEILKRNIFPKAISVECVSVQGWAEKHHHHPEDSGQPNFPMPA